jgi:hypothetical protein
LASWELSKQPEKQVSQRKRPAQSRVQSGKDAEQPVETTTRVRDQTGDPAYLTQARAALAEIRDILGINALKKYAATDPTGETAAPSPVRIICLPDNHRQDGLDEDKDLGDS